MLGSGLERKKSFLQLIEREWPREWGRGAPAASQPAGAWLQLWASQGELVSSVHTLHWSSAESLVLSMRHGLAQLPEAQLAALKAAAPRPHERDVHPALLDAACATARHLIDGLPAPHDPLTDAARGRGQTHLLVLAGRTYHTRLWCVMELFVYLRMGGAHSSMLVRLLDDDDRDLAQLPAKFDAGKSQCFLDGDRQRLLAVIESSFGTFEPFNKIVRGILHDKLVGVEASAT